MLGRISEIRYQISAIRKKRRQGADQSWRGGNGGLCKVKPKSTVPSRFRASKSDCATGSASCDFGVDLLVLVLAHAAQIAERPSFAEQDGHTGQRA